MTALPLYQISAAFIAREHVRFEMNESNLHTNKTILPPLFCMSNDLKIQMCYKLK